MQTRAIIFDLDGVLVDTAKYHYMAWKSLANELGMEFDEEVNEQLKGVSRMRSFEIILEHNGAEGKYTEDEKEAFCAKKNALYVEYIGTLKPEDTLSGVLCFIDKAREAGLKTAVASVSKNAPAVLSALKISHLFDYVADAAKVTKSKPDPEIFSVCAEALGVDPAYCIGIEDSQAGVEAIKAAGMKSVGINVTVTSLAPDVALKATEELDFEKLVK